MREDQGAGRAVRDAREPGPGDQSDIAHAARAATYGAVDTLIFDIDEVVHGTVAEEDGAVTFADESLGRQLRDRRRDRRRALKSGAHSDRGAQGRHSRQRQPGGDPALSDLSRGRRRRCGCAGRTSDRG
jgi:hypothetical protein